MIIISRPGVANNDEFCLNCYVKLEDRDVYKCCRLYHDDTGQRHIRVRTVPGEAITVPLRTGSALRACRVERSSFGPATPAKSAFSWEVESCRVSLNISCVSIRLPYAGTATAPGSLGIRPYHP